MVLDYVLPQQFIPRKAWWSMHLSGTEQKNLLQAIRVDATVAGEDFAALNIGERELFKHTLLVPVAFDFAALQQGRVERNDGIMLVYFRQGDTPFITTMPAKALGV